MVQTTNQSKEEQLKEKLAEIALSEKEVATRQQARQQSMPYIDLTNVPIIPDNLSLIDEETAKKLKIICFNQDKEKIELATIQPNLSEITKLTQQLNQRHTKTIKIYLISLRSFESAFKLYRTIPKVIKITKGVKITESEITKYQQEITSWRELNNKIQGVSTTDILTIVIANALSSRASDIHIEAEEKDVKIRFRIDGVLIDVASLQRNTWKQIINRIKLISSLKINISNQPQDGRFTIFLSNDKVDVRVSCLPTTYGESVVMRLLKSSNAGLAFEKLGIRGKAGEQLKKEIERPNGMIITTGPTGSGKTTSLYAILNKLNKPEIKIITLENPVEYKLAGINQSQIDPSKDYSFANGLRSILRQDPDIIMVGEIRDLETAEVSIQSALTGHLVISTLHTNDAAGAIPRFLSMGVKPFLLAPALNAIIAQRLVRRICPHCKKEIKLDPEKLDQVKKIFSTVPNNSGEKIDLNNLKFYQGSGCDKCQGLGYHGRIGIYEILIIDKEIEKVILSGQVSEYQMKDIAKQQGMITMIQDGLLKATGGITTVEEVFRVSQ